MEKVLNTKEQATEIFKLSDIVMFKWNRKIYKGKVIMVFLNHLDVDCGNGIIKSIEKNKCQITQLKLHIL